MKNVAVTLKQTILWSVHCTVCTSVYILCLHKTTVLYTIMVHIDKQPLGDGKTIKVEFAIHMEPPGGYGGYRGGGGGGFRGGGGGGGFRGRGRGDFGGGGGGGGGGGRDRDRGGNQPGFTPAAGDWECPDPK